MQRVREQAEDARARGAERVPERDGAAERVEARVGRVDAREAAKGRVPVLARDKAAERRAAVVVRGLSFAPSDRPASDLLRPPGQDLYL